MGDQDPNRSAQEPAGAMTLASLTKMLSDRSPWGKDERDELIDTISRRMGMKGAIASPESHSPDKEPAPSGQELENLRRALARGQKSEEFGEAFEKLTRHDPGPVVEFLLAWVNPKIKTGARTRTRDPRSRLVLRLAVRERGPPAGNHSWPRLSEAKDPFIRVAGARSTCASRTPTRERLRSSGRPRPVVTQALGQR